MAKCALFLFFVCGGGYIACINFSNILALREITPDVLLVVPTIGHIGFSFYFTIKEFSQGYDKQLVTWNFSAYIIVNAILVLIFMITKNRLFIYLVGLSGGIGALSFGILNIKALIKKSD